MATGKEFQGKRAGGTLTPIREAQKALTRQRLLEASIECFVENGYVATNIDDIVARAGATRGTFYLHFPQKSSVFLEMYSEANDDSVEIWGTLNAAVEAGTEIAYHGWVARVLEYWEKHGQTIAVADQASAVEPAVSELLEQQREAAIAAMVAGMRSRITGSKLELRLRAAACYALISGLFEEWLTTRSPKLRPIARGILVSSLITLLDSQD